MTDFDDYRLEDERTLTAADPVLRHLAEAGGRVRIECEASEGAISGLDAADRPRAVVAVGPEARLVRGLLEPVCPVPFVAWPSAGLPGWVGPLDLVVVLAPQSPEVLDDAASGQSQLVATAHEAVRRGARLLVTCADDSPLVDHAQSSGTTFLTARTGDNLAAAVITCAALHRLGLGPAVHPELIADVLDDVARRSSPHVDLATNPGKDLALVLADAVPLVWGGSTLAARAARRTAEGFRSVSGRPALAADAEALLPVIEQAAVRDPFADPFEDSTSSRPVLVVFDDGSADEGVAAARTGLTAAADRQDVRVSVVQHDEGDELSRYAGLLQLGRYGVAYLAVGLGRHGG
ncbi:SIS domain-containing protein [Microlunatus sp. Y2014]|uniref:SIS domain-containing protein n=1 Tax=Microlunatus sp. Y2014 TaxID=3418488 RepID=UPI003DA703AC